MTVATCKTCGATLPGPHRPSMFDKDGIGNPEHKMTIDSPGEVEHAIESIRCGMEGCKNWCVEGELYCSYHLGPYLEAHPKHTPQPTGGVTTDFEITINEALDLAHPMAPQGFWRKVRAKDQLLTALEALLAAERTKARINELEKFQGSDDYPAEWFVGTIKLRLAELRSNDSYGKIDQKDD